MSDKDQKLSYSYQVGPSHWVRSIDGGGISFEKIKSTLLDLIKGGAQITLINDANTKTIGYSYTSETISEKKVFDENLYLIECVYNDDVDLKITGFTE